MTFAGKLIPDNNNEKFTSDWNWKKVTWYCYHWLFPLRIDEWAGGRGKILKVTALDYGKFSISIFQTSMLKERILISFGLYTTVPIFTLLYLFSAAEFCNIKISFQVTMYIVRDDSVFKHHNPFPWIPFKLSLFISYCTLICAQKYHGDYIMKQCRIPHKSPC